MTISPSYNYHSRLWFACFIVIMINVNIIFLFCRTLEPVYDYLPDDIEYDTPVVNTNVPVTIETSYVNTKLKEPQQAEPMHSLNEPVHNDLPDDMEYETPVVINNVPVTTETNC